MKRFFVSMLFSAAVLLAASVSVIAAGDQKYDAGMSKVYIGENKADKGKDHLHIRSGAYLMSGARQMRITGSNGNVSLFKGQLPNNGASLTDLKDGDTLEYSGVMYMTLTQMRSTRPDEGEAALSPLRYSPVRTVSMLQLCGGCYTEADNGTVIVYDRYGEERIRAYRGYAAELSGYILNGDIVFSSETGESREKKTVVFSEGQTYTVGSDIESGSYTGSGSGIVRVYNAAGYPKTVIKLKDAEDPAADGVDSYGFELGENETIITEGRVVFTENDDPVR